MPNPIRTYYNSGSLRIEEWRDENNKFHRINDPTIKYYYENGNLKSEGWYENDKCHRIDGPAIQIWDENGNPLIEGWYINNIQLTDKEVTVLKRKLKLQQI